MRVLRSYDDQSIFAWGDPVDGNRSLLAPSPLAFVNSNRVITCATGFRSGPYLMANKGLNITLPLIETTKQTYVILACRFADNFRGPLALRNIEGEDVFSVSRTGRRLSIIDLTMLATAKARSIFIQREDFKALHHTPTPSHLLTTGHDSRPGSVSFWVRTSFTKGINNTSIIYPRPRHYWNSQASVFWLPSGGTTCSLILHHSCDIGSAYVWSNDAQGTSG